MVDMSKRAQFIAIAFLGLLLIFAVHRIDAAQVQQPADSVPPAPARTAQRLYEQLGMCQADTRDLQDWKNSMADKIHEKDAEIQKLNAEIAKLKGPAKPE